MARIEHGTCSKCGETYTYVENSHIWRREKLCDTCKAKDQQAKVQALKAELGALTRSPILMLLAEVGVLRDQLVKSGQIDEIGHFKAVIAAVKEMTDFIDGKADQTEHQAGGSAQDP